MSDQIVEKPIKNTNFPKILLMVLGSLALISLGAAGIYGIVRQKPEWFGVKFSDSKSEKDVQAEINSLVEEVGKLIDLPKDETPTIATVSDVEKVKDQPFFKKAKEGDKVLVYQTAKKAILYRPSAKMIMEVGVVNLEEQPVAGSITPKPNSVSFTPTPVVATSSPSPKPTSMFTPTVMPNSQ